MEFELFNGGKKPSNINSNNNIRNKSNQFDIRNQSGKLKQKLLVNIGENFSFGKIKIFGIYFWTLIYFNESRNIANA